MSRTDGNIHHAGIFGRRLSGKTVLTIEICRASYEKEKRFAVVLDPKMQQHAWGPHCYVTNDRAKWLAKWQHTDCRNCNIVWEESATTIKRDLDLVDVFTAKAGEHGHRLIVTGHSGKSLLPVMREQLTELFIFRQSRTEAEMWTEQFSDERIMVACELNFEEQEFLHVKMGREPKRCPRIVRHEAD